MAFYFKRSKDVMIPKKAKKHCLPLKKIKFRFLVLTPDDVIKTQDQRNVRNLLPGNATFV